MGEEEVVDSDKEDEETDKAGILNKFLSFDGIPIILNRRKSF